MKTYIQLSDGTVIGSGAGTVPAILACDMVWSVNKGQDLNPGSVCAGTAEIKILTGKNELSIRRGEKLRIFRRNAEEPWILAGIFICEKPVISNSILTVTAYDSVVLLDKDLTQWMKSLTGWPYSLLNFTRMVCSQCGLNFVSESFPNAFFPVEKFTAQGIKGRDLICWAAQIAGRFCRATSLGELEFAWYTPADVTIETGYSAEKMICQYRFEDKNLILKSGSAGIIYDRGKLGITSDFLKGSFHEKQKNLSLVLIPSAHTLKCYRDSLRKEDYIVKPIEKVQIRQCDDDIGIVFPDVPGEKNTYEITGNYLLTAGTPENLKRAAENLYHVLSAFSYVPCRMTLPAGFCVNAGNILKIRQEDGREFTTCVMTKKQSADRDSIISSGSPDRNASAAVNNRQFTALSGRMMAIKTDVNGLSVRVEQVNQGFQTEIKDFSDRITADLDRMQDQVDGKIISYFEEYLPNSDNLPASQWTTDAEKKKHLGDVFYVTGMGPDAGKAFRWSYSGGIYQWELLPVGGIGEALTAAAKAQDTADGKRRVFIKKPYPPYDAGDLWSQGTAGALRICQTGRSSGSFHTEDWIEATNTSSRFKILSDRITSEVSGANGKASKAQQTADQVSAEVKGRLEKDCSDSFSTFGWRLTNRKWEIKAGNQAVFTVTDQGAYVEGEIRAVKGSIGGFNIVGSSLSTNRATWNNSAGGIYFGPEGVYINNALTIWSSGSIYASKAEIHGDIYGENGYFHGTVRAGKIEYGSDDGYFSGDGLSGRSVTTGKITSGMETSLGYADYANQVLTGVSRAGAIYANHLSAVTSFSFKEHTVAWKLIGSTWYLVRLGT